ncbi:uncharacterized protein LOC134747016 isoform X1 [Cydia strobilella]|uniref:uncharacterized protein LOC134747016 isoform X1 n=1 Tax=Cydia strobilella TaxID=1100964 RepID=UPI003005AD77
MPFCVSCSTTVEKKSWVGHLRSNKHKTKSNSIQEICDGVDLIQSAFRNRIATYRISAHNDQISCSIDIFLNSIRDQIKLLFNKSLQKHTCIKVNVELFGMFMLFKNNTQSMKSFGTKNKVLYQSYDFERYYDEVINSLKKKVDEFQERDSGWTFLHNSHLEININKFQPLHGSSFIEIPKFIRNKKACVNIQNKDQCCFAWCVTAALFPAKNHPERVSSYPHFDNVLNTQGLSFPMTLSDIKIFEKYNPSLAFIVFGLKEKTIVGPLYNSENHTRKKTIHLLLLENGISSHFCLIKDLSRLVRSQITAHHGKIYFCETCLVFFSKEDQLANHLCSGIVTELPEKGTVIKFKNYERKQNMPFVIYADFESILPRASECHCGTDCTLHSSDNTETLQHHTPAAFAYYVVCSVDSAYNRYVTYRGFDCVDKFVDLIYKDIAEIKKILDANTPMQFNPSDEISFNSATRCHICNNFLFSDKVRDHCHISGCYRGAAHSYCNLRFKTPSFVPIYFHNLSGYDAHLFMKKLGVARGTMKLVAKTKENYVSFTKFIPIEDDFFQLRFVDSFKFLGTSLEKLVNTMKREDFVHLRRFFPKSNQFQLLTRKGVYPYEYMNDWERYNEQCLPPEKCFYSSLSNENVSHEDYEHACLVWKEFNIENLGEYTDLYLKTDVLLLADIYEKFRDTCRKNYSLDPAYYLTAPSLTFDAMLLITGVELELIDDFNMLSMIQNGIRGGVCLCPHRQAKANNKYIPGYNPSQPDSYVIYIDCNNLYGYSMCQYLPLSNFRFLEQHEIDALDITQVPNEAKYGFILEVDLIYPKDLHKEHNDLPFCPEKCIPPGGKSSKLVPNLYDKYFYVIHYVHLKTCLKHGLKIKKVHRVITFMQDSYLQQYIDLNTKLRQKASSKFEQDLFKVMINSLFGKTLENNYKKVNVQLVNQWNDITNLTKKKTSAAELIARPNFHSISIFSDNLVAVQMSSDHVMLDKPIYIGFTVLELSKSHMYDFHYSVFKPMYGNRLQLCYTDTDSYIYHIQTKNYYNDLKTSLLPYFDTSNYSIDNVHRLPIQNKKVPGLFKDELDGKYIIEFVGLRSKLYCVKTNEDVIQKAKGVSKSVIREFGIRHYEKSLIRGDVIKKKNILFRSIKHEIFTQSVNKIILSANDDKRMISDDKISTRAWGHTSILNI